MQTARAQKLEYLIWLVALVVFYGPLVYLLKDGLLVGTTDLPWDIVVHSLTNTLWVAAGAVLLAGGLGTLVAWCLYFYPIAGGSLLRLGFFLPLVLPAYVVAFAFLGGLGQTQFSPQGQLWGLILVLTAGLYPYVYIFVYNGLRTIDHREWEVHQVLGQSRWFFTRQVVFKRLRPFLLSALMLVVFETLADFGAASIININVVTTLIYKVWFGYFSFPGAMLVASYYMMLILLLLYLEQRLGFNSVTQQIHQPLSLPSHPVITGLAGIFLWLLFAVTFILPVGQIVAWFFAGIGEWAASKSYGAFFNSLLLGFGTSLLVLVMVLLLAYLLRRLRVNFAPWRALVSVGYSMPGTVLAVAMVIVAAWVGGPEQGLMGLALLMVGLGYKFYAGGFRSVAGALETIPLTLDDYHHTTCRPWWWFFYRGHWPLLRPALAGTFAYVAIEVFKEMPLTLMLAPSEFDTLSRQIFNFTSEGEWELAAVPGLLLIGAGVVSTFLLYQRVHRRANGAY